MVSESGSKPLFFPIMYKFKQTVLYVSWGEGKLIFCCTGSQENYFGSVGWWNNNPKFQGWHI